MQFSILKTLTVAIGLTSSTLANPILAPRSIPALQGWPGKNYTGTQSYAQFCSPNDCCNITVWKGYTEIPLRVPVLSVNTLDAGVSLKKGAQAKLWKGDECTGEPVSTFDPFKGVADLGTPMTFGAVSYVNSEE